MSYPLFVMNCCIVRLSDKLAVLPKAGARSVLRYDFSLSEIDRHHVLMHPAREADKRNQVPRHVVV